MVSWSSNKLDIQEVDCLNLLLINFIKNGETQQTSKKKDGINSCGRIMQKCFVCENDGLLVFQMN
jgi:hypothetical protein